MRKFLAILMIGISVASLVACTANAQKVKMSTKGFDLKDFTKV